MNLSKFENFIDNSYQIVLWPAVQNLMEYDWFREECILYNAFDDQPFLDSAYFVPVRRLMEIDPEIQQTVNSFNLNNPKPKL